MTRSIRPLIDTFRRKSLPACVAAILAVNAVAAPNHRDAKSSENRSNVSSSVLTVQNCADSGPGSLREAIFNAASGSTIDLTQLQCSEITLLSGEIDVTVDGLKVMGPGADPGSAHHLTIYGGAGYGYKYRIFEAGTGTFTISGLKLADAHYQGQGALVKGGCVTSAGTLIIEDSIVSGCEIEALYGSSVPAFGGAVYAREKLSVTNSIIANNMAYSGTSTDAYGGGIATGGFLTIQNSTIADNKAITPSGFGVGGGVMVFGWGDVLVFGSTISGNEAGVAGGLRVSTLGSLAITNSTLSGNYAFYIGGASVASSSVTLKNSTVTRNSAYVGTLGVGIYSETGVTAESTILADNVDVATGSTLDVAAPSIDGAANLITAASSDTPPDTVSACPRLTALQDHGGPTLTHAHIPGSPGINAGSNTIPLDTDQRGTLPYTRVFGARADIGAYEWHGESDESIFRSAFENRCDRYD
jgi:hypothetical protein